MADLFCGAGGFSAGFENSGGFDVILGIDNQKDCTDTFAANYSGAIVMCSDIRDIRNEKIVELSDSLGPFDVVLGSPPCQGFSSLRPFRSITDDDSRNNLYEEFGRFINITKPTIFVMENVVGLLTHRKEGSLRSIISRFRELGYTVNYSVLNSVHYGVPQRRERVIIIGAMGERIRFPDPSHFCNNGRSMARKKDRMTVRDSSQQLLLVDDSERAKELLPALSVMDAIGDLPIIKSGEEKTTYRNNFPLNQYQKSRRKNLEILTLHKATNHTKRMLEIISKSGSNRYALPEGMVKSGFSTAYSRLDADEPSVTVTVNFVHPASNKCIHPYQDRALTPREGARIQSFNDDYIFHGNRSSIVRQIGNAVPPLLGQAIADEILKLLKNP